MIAVIIGFGTKVFWFVLSAPALVSLKPPLTSLLEIAFALNESPIFLKFSLIFE